MARVRVALGDLARVAGLRPRDALHLPAGRSARGLDHRIRRGAVAPLRGPRPDARGAPGRRPQPGRGRRRLHDPDPLPRPPPVRPAGVLRGHDVRWHHGRLLRRPGGGRAPDHGGSLVSRRGAPAAVARAHLLRVRALRRAQRRAPARRRPARRRGRGERGSRGPRADAVLLRARRPVARRPRAGRRRRRARRGRGVARAPGGAAGPGEPGSVPRSPGPSWTWSPSSLWRA